MAFRTVWLQTPARAAMCPMVRVQAPFPATSAAMTDSTALSANVNLLWIWGGSLPDAAHFRRRSMLSDERGRDPTRRGTGLLSGGMALRVSMNSESSVACASVTVPAA
jgi:hypothetical protein